MDVTFGDRLPADIRVVRCSGFKVCPQMYECERVGMPVCYQREV